MDATSFKAVAVRSPRGATVTEIDWADGHKGRYPHEIMRGYCPCAGCQGHSGNIVFVPPAAHQLEIDRFDAVGRYALQIVWFDGHDTGLYSYKYLRALCQCEACVGASPAASHSPVDRA